MRKDISYHTEGTEKKKKEGTHAYEHIQHYYGHPSLARITIVIFSWHSQGESPPALAVAMLQNQ